MNLAELYFESLEGYANPARFTPFNALVRAEFQARQGFDPQELYQPGGANSYARNPAALRKFLDYRAALAARLQEGWLTRLYALRQSQPHLDLVLTHIDDRFDPSMRDKLGADVPLLLGSAQRRGVTFLVEDPATVWHLGPERYAEIARRYAALTKRADLLAIDLNITERYQDVYPVKQQTGTELFQLVRSAAESFERVALYFENSILPPDWPLLAAAAAPVRQAAWTGSDLEIDSPRPVSVAWKGCALVDGRAWPVQDGERVLVAAGNHKLSPCQELPPQRLADFNGDVDRCAHRARQNPREIREPVARDRAGQRRQRRLEREDAAAGPAGGGDSRVMSKAGGNGFISEKPAEKSEGGSSGPADSNHLPAGRSHRELCVPFTPVERVPARDAAGSVLRRSCKLLELDVRFSREFAVVAELDHVALAASRAQAGDGLVLNRQQIALVVDFDEAVVEDDCSRS